MERIDKILNHPIFVENLHKNEAAEEDREFCRHNMVHFLDVARIGRIINSEEAFGLSVEWIYAAALLHDIGKHLQYAQEIPHEKASAQIAPSILKDCGFDEQEMEAIVTAISTHRDASVKAEKDLRGLLYRADKLSRACFACKAEAQCNWKDGKKNCKVRY